MNYVRQDILENLIKIREEIQIYQDKIESDRRTRMQFIAALGGVSLVAILGLAYNSIVNSAEQVSRGAVEEALERVETAEKRLESSAKEFDALRAQITNTFDLVEGMKVEIRELVGDVETSLARVKAAEGGVSVANELTRIYRVMFELQTQISDGQRHVEPAGPTVGELFPDFSGATNVQETEGITE